MKKNIPPLFLCFLWLIVGLLLGYYFGSEYGWNKDIHNPYSHKQTMINTDPLCNALTNISPTQGTKITSPLTVTVTIDNTKSCKWTVFEAQAGSLTLTDSKGRTLGTGTLTTTDDWMTDQPVIYNGTIKFSTPETSDVTLIIKEEDPSGQGAQTVSIPLKY